ncbi:inner membrane complex protein imc2a [Cystoisospora suis]|uniref:Inner membrane complex protein imc2a n=1 Tax=Cystoisospora suis TaxID=483139 RepID=A0A2C6LAG2_9APIC|nr:inner membrane complex protein imc2a [Cystoisospora suis]
MPASANFRSIRYLNRSPCSMGAGVGEDSGNFYADAFRRAESRQETPRSPLCSFKYPSFLLGGFVVFLLFLCAAPLPPSVFTANERLGLPSFPRVGSAEAAPAPEGATPRRLSGLVKSLVLWEPVERFMPSLNMDTIVFVAGKHRGDRSAALQATVDDVMMIFFRLFDESKTSWPLQSYVMEAALFREQERYQNQLVQEEIEKRDSQQEDPEIQRSKILTIEVYTQLAGAKRRVRDWLFDGDMFHRTGPEGPRLISKETLSERDLGFLRGVPYSVLRVAHGALGEKLPASAERLLRELKKRDVHTAEDILLKTNFADLFVLFNVFDETFTQIDILRGYWDQWRNQKEHNITPPLLPPGEWTGKQSLEESVRDSTFPPTEFPKCTTVTCFMEHTWAQRASDHVIEVRKSNVNSLKLLLVGNTGVADYADHKERSRFWYKFKRFFWANEFEQTVKALKWWHETEKADAVFGLGDFLGFPGPTSARDERFDKKWYDIFVKDGGLDIPWLMTMGEEEGFTNPSASIRHHYTMQHPNWYMPNDFYTVTFDFATNMTMADGSIEEERFNVTVVNMNTWSLFAGSPVANNMQAMMHRMMWLSEQLHAAVMQNSTWLIVVGHHPMLSTGAQAEQGRLQHIDDLYTNGQPRGTEALIIQKLLLHYQVDAYVSGHDFIMEYDTIEDLDKDTTLAFITSGSAARLLDKDIGRGWFGRLRGFLYPALCWAGRRIFFALHPGGCKPESREHDHPYRFFAPLHGHYKASVVERVTKATGFAAMKLTKEYMLVDFIDGKKQKSVKRINKRSNKPQRDIHFMDPVAEGHLRYDELEFDRAAFAESNAELLEKEVAFVRKCPVLAERIKFYVEEINNLVDSYDALGKQKDAYEVMDDNTVEVLMAQGVNVMSKITQASSEMDVLASDYASMMRKYKELVSVKNSSPAGDDQRYAELFQLEKAFVETRKVRQFTARQLAQNEGIPDREGEKELERLILHMQVLRKEINALESSIKKSPQLASKEDKDDSSASQSFSQGSGGNPSVKEPDSSLEARIEKKLKQVLLHEETLSTLEKEGDKAKLGQAKRQLDVLRTELKDLEERLETQTKPMKPSTAWTKFQQQRELEANLEQIQALSSQMSQLPAELQASAEVKTQLQLIANQKAAIEDELEAIRDELGTRKPTPLEEQCLEKKTELMRMHAILEEAARMPTESLETGGLKETVEAAKQIVPQLEQEFLQLVDQVKAELSAQDAVFAEGLVTPGAESKRADMGLGKGDVTAAFDLGDKGKVDALMHEYAEVERALETVQQALEMYKSVTGEERKTLEEFLGTREEVEAKKVALQDRLKELEQEVKKEAEKVGAGTVREKVEGSPKRRLMAALLQKKATPYPKLDKIETGPQDGCLQIPMLEAQIRFIVEPGLKDLTKEKCVFVFASQAYQRQYKVFQPADFFSQGQKGLQTILYSVPSVHVSRAWNQMFGSLHLHRFRMLMKAMKEGMRQVQKEFRVLSFKEAIEAEGKSGASESSVPSSDAKDR